MDRQQGFHSKALRIGQAEELEGQELKKFIDFHCSKLTEKDSVSLEMIQNIMRFSSNTRQKALDHLKGHFPALTDLYKGLEASRKKEQVADFLSLVCMDFKDSSIESVEYLLEGTRQNFTEWGALYVHNLTKGIIENYDRARQNIRYLSNIIQKKKKSDYYYNKNCKIIQR